ncbi:MAG: hypothetical protein AAF390_19065, partial [Pseudomonadota bacterium]
MLPFLAAPSQAPSPPAGHAQSRAERLASEDDALAFREAFDRSGEEEAIRPEGEAVELEEHADELVEGAETALGDVLPEEADGAESFHIATPVAAPATG